MVQEKVFTKVLNARVVLILLSLLLGTLFITPCWGMDPPPDKTNSRSSLLKKFTSKKSKNKGKTKKDLTPPSEAKSPGSGRQRSHTIQTDVPTQTPGTPGRKRADTMQSDVPTLPPGIPGRKRADTMQSDVPHKKPSLRKELTNSQKPPQPQEEVTYVKRIHSFAEWESAQTGKGLGTYRTLIIDIPAYKAEEQLAFNQLFQNPHAFYLLLSKYPKITTLSLSGLPLGEDESRMKGLVGHLQSMPLKHLSIVKCGLKKTEMKYLSSILVSSTLATHLEELNVSKNDMSDAGVQAFVPGLKKNFSLTHMDMSYNSITHVGVQDLVKGLEENSALRKQRFSQQEFGQLGFKQLNLSHNQIEDEGAQHILKLFDVLSDVNLGNNRITGCGIKSLLQALNNWEPPTPASSFKLYLQKNTFEITDKFNLIVLHEPEPNDLCLIQGCKLGLFEEKGKLYCKCGDRDILEVPVSNDPTQGLPLDVIEETATFINRHFENDLSLEILQDQLDKIKTQLIIYTSTTGYTPILNNLEEYNDLLKTLPTKRVDVLLPDMTFYRFTRKSSPTPSYSRNSS